jgi:hypothetical protein
MDCTKNLTACMGCTKKHAKCAWKDVVEDEMRVDFFDLSAREHRERGTSHGDDSAGGEDGSLSVA